VHTPLVQCNLTALCLQYLTFACFDVETTQEQLQDLAVQGYFVFQDYAVANWSHHLLNMVEIGHQLFAESLEAQRELQEEVQEAVQELNDALWEFTSAYDDDLLEEPIDKSSEETCEAFRQYGFYYSLQLVWSHAHLHQQKDFEARNDVSLKALGNMLVRNRKLLEDLTSFPALLAQEQQEDVAAFYGDKRYKCPKVTCYYFHEGFKDAKSRDRHINRHDRPFRCTFPDCSVADFGFGSSKELEKHARLFHPSTEDMCMTFAAPKAAPVATSKWVCHICSKRFTRNFHLTSHIRAHRAERPFTCSECGKAFTRANDCRRHEKIHARR
jgi:Zinc finger, C2H2 type